MEIEAILFDMDGVLVDARDWHYEALNNALALFGHTISRYEHLVTFDGLPTSKKLELLSLDSSLPTGLHKIINEIKQQYTHQFFQINCRPNYTLEYTMSRLSREGVRLGCCSNSIRKSLETVMTLTHLAKYMTVLLSNEDVTKPKPDPEIYQKAMRLLSVHPERCVIVEDNPNGIKAARDAGAHVFEVSSTADVTYSNLSSFIDGLRE